MLTDLWHWLQARRKRRAGCTRRDCQVCKHGWPVDGKPLSDRETERLILIRCSLHSETADDPLAGYRVQP